MHESEFWCVTKLMNINIYISRVTFTDTFLLIDCYIRYRPPTILRCCLLFSLELLNDDSLAFSLFFRFYRAIES